MGFLFSDGKLFSADYQEDVMRVSGHGMGNGFDFGGENVLWGTHGGGVKTQAAVCGQIISKLFWLLETNRCGTVIVFTLQSRKLDVDITSQHISMGLLFGVRRSYWIWILPVDRQIFSLYSRV